VRSVGVPFPKFNLVGCVNRKAGMAFRMFSNETFPGKWVVYFFWPNDFTPICRTELVAFAEMAQDFAERDAVLIGGSIDSEFVHFAWSQQGEGSDQLPFALLADVRRDLTQQLGILDPEKGVAQRATFIVDPKNTIRHASANEFSVGRNPREILRIVDALQTDALCPSGWESGQPTIDRTTAFVEPIANAPTLNPRRATIG
jgi:alkyl hydroperoxide reductase subunit AhpC